VAMPVPVIDRCVSGFCFLWVVNVGRVDLVLCEACFSWEGSRSPGVSEGF
jgi:hypothetical protein